MFKSKSVLYSIIFVQSFPTNSFFKNAFFEVLIRNFKLTTRQLFNCLYQLILADVTLIGKGSFDSPRPRVLGSMQYINVYTNTHSLISRLNKQPAVCHKGITISPTVQL